MKLAIQDFAPDRDTTIFPGKAGAAYLTDSNWVYSLIGGWAAMPTPLHAPNNPHIPNPCLGCFSYEVNGGINIVMASGTPASAPTAANQLYVWSGGSAVNQLLKLSPNTNIWSFTSYGNDAIGVNGVDRPVVSTNGGTWVPLGGQPPVFSIIEATDYSLFGVIPNSQTVYFTLADTIWIPSIATETGTINFTGTSGNITAAQRVRGGIAIFKQTSMLQGSFTGPPLFWNFQAVSETVGTFSQNTVVSADDVLYFIGPNEFYSFDGYSLNPLPNNLSQWFFQNCPETALVNPGLIRAAYDQPRRQVVWYFQSGAAAGQTYMDRYISMSLLTGRWSTGYRKVEAPIDSGSNPANPFDYGFVDEAHMLRLINFDPNEKDDAELAWITTGPIGDKANIYRIGRVLPGWLSVPSGTQDPVPIPPLPSLDVFQTYISGEADTRSQSCRWSPQTGWFDLVAAARMQRLKVSFSPGYILSDLDVDLVFAGRQ